MRPAAPALRRDVDVLVERALGEAGVRIVGELYASALMSLGTQVHALEAIEAAGLSEQDAHGDS
jgi:hypothetical protein